MLLGFHFLSTYTNLRKPDLANVIPCMKQNELLICTLSRIVCSMVLFCISLFPDFILFFFNFCLQLALHSINSSRSAYQSITFKPEFFDVYNIAGNQVECSVLLKVLKHSLP